MFCKGKTYMGSGEDWTAFFFPFAFCSPAGASHGRVDGPAGMVSWLWGIGISGRTFVSDTKTSPKRSCNVSTKSSSSWSRSMIVVVISTVSEWAADLSDTSPACASIAEITSSFVVSVCTPFLCQTSAAASCCTCLLMSSSRKRIDGKRREAEQHEYTLHCAEHEYSRQNNLHLHALQCCVFSQLFPVLV